MAKLIDLKLRVENRNAKANAIAVAESKASDKAMLASFIKTNADTDKVDLLPKKEAPEVKTAAERKTARTIALYTKPDKKKDSVPFTAETREKVRPVIEALTKSGALEVTLDYARRTSIPSKELAEMMSAGNGRGIRFNADVLYAEEYEE